MGEERDSRAHKQTNSRTGIGREIKQNLHDNTRIMHYTKSVFGIDFRFDIVGMFASAKIFVAASEETSVGLYVTHSPHVIKRG